LEQDCIINIFATMIILQEAYQKQTDFELELAHKKLLEMEKEIAEERTKNQVLVKEEKDLLKLLQHTQEKVMEKSKVSSMAENNKKSIKQKLEEEIEKNQSLEKVSFLRLIWNWLHQQTDFVFRKLRR